jgi:hypothetical protein
VAVEVNIFVVNTPPQITCIKSYCKLNIDLIQRSMQATPLISITANEKKVRYLFSIHLSFLNMYFFFLIFFFMSLIPMFEFTGGMSTQNIGEKLLLSRYF